MLGVAAVGDAEDRLGVVDVGQRPERLLLVLAREVAREEVRGLERRAREDRPEFVDELAVAVAALVLRRRGQRRDGGGAPGHDGRLDGVEPLRHDHARGRVRQILAGLEAPEAGPEVADEHVLGRGLIEAPPVVREVEPREAAALRRVARHRRLPGPVRGVAREPGLVAPGPDAARGPLARALGLLGRALELAEEQLALRADEPRLGPRRPRGVAVVHRDAAHAGEGVLGQGQGRALGVLAQLVQVVAQRRLEALALLGELLVLAGRQRLPLLRVAAEPEHAAGREEEGRRAAVRAAAGRVEERHGAEHGHGRGLAVLEVVLHHLLRAEALRRAEVGVLLARRVRAGQLRALEQVVEVPAERLRERRGRAELVGHVARLPAGRDAGLAAPRGRLGGELLLAVVGLGLVLAAGGARLLERRLAPRFAGGLAHLLEERRAAAFGVYGRGCSGCCDRFVAVGGVIVVVDVAATR